MANNCECKGIGRSTGIVGIHRIHSIGTLSKRPRSALEAAKLSVSDFWQWRVYPRAIPAPRRVRDLHPPLQSSASNLV